MNQSTANRLPTLNSKTDAEDLVVRIGETMDALIHLMEAETRLIKVGKLVEASRLQPDKAELASRFVCDFQTFKMNAPTLMAHVPQMVERLKQRYETFKANLQINMAVLETAKTLSESLVSEMAEIVGRQDKPVTYGYDGRNRSASNTAPSPVTINRKF